MMQKIEKHNCDGLCEEEFCSNPQEYYAKTEIYGLKLIVSLCKKHAEQWDKEEWRRDVEAQFQRTHGLRP